MAGFDNRSNRSTGQLRGAVQDASELSRAVDRIRTHIRAGASLAELREVGLLPKVEVKHFHVVAPGEGAFRIITNYQQALQESGTKEFSAALLNLPAKELIPAFNLYRRLSLKLGPQDSLPTLHPGEQINLRRVFGLYASGSVQRLFQEEGPGSIPAVSGRESSGGGGGISPAKQKVMSEAEVVRLARSVQALLSADGKEVALSLQLGIAQAESSFRPNVISTANAHGLFQVKRIAAVDVWPQVQSREGKPLSTEALHEPMVNIETGARYFHNCLTRFDGNIRNALAAYNQGPTRVEADLLIKAETGALSPQLGEGYRYADKVLGFARAFEQKYGSYAVASDF